MDSNSKQYLYTNNSIYILAIGERAGGGFWRIPCSGQADWQYLHPDSKDYDSFHQSIFRNRRDFDEVDFEAVKPLLHPIPSTPIYRPMQWKDNFPEVLFTEQLYPGLWKLLLESKTQSVECWVVFFEDVYESKLGDGVFYYYHRVFTKAEDAEAYCHQQTTEWRRYFSLVKSIGLKDGKADLEKAVCNTRPYHYDLNKVLTDWEQLITNKH